MKITIRSVLVSDAVDPLCVDLLRKRGINVTCKYKLPKEHLIQELQGVDALIVRSDTKVTKDIINSAPGLRVIGRAGTGVDNIDLDAATKKGIIVINTPGGNSISACELTCALISSLARNVPQACQSLKEGRWDRKLYTGSELSGKTLAVLGLGRIGREVALRMQSYGMRTIGYDPIISKDQAKSFNVDKMELDEIWPIADYITVHTPLIPQTRNLINEKTLNKSKKGVCIVNVARGGIVEEAALLTALKDGRCGGAALDVYEEEPPKGETTLELIKHPLVVATPHLGASTDEAQQRVAVEVAEQLIALSGNNLEGENFAVTGAVNAPVLAATMEEANLPWIDLTQRLGQLLGRLAKEKGVINKINVTTSGDVLASKTFLTIPALAGVLEKSAPSVNLINAPGLAKDQGVTAVKEHKAGSNYVSVSDNTNTVTGTLGANNAPVLISVNNLDLAPGVGLEGYITIVKSKGELELTSLVSEVQQTKAVMTNLSLGRDATGGGIAIIRTTEPLRLVSSVGTVF